jgi:hypothetical protein
VPTDVAEQVQAELRRASIEHRLYKQDERTIFTWDPADNPQAMKIVLGVLNETGT